METSDERRSTEAQEVLDLLETRNKMKYETVIFNRFVTMVHRISVKSEFLSPLYRSHTFMILLQKFRTLGLKTEKLRKRSFM